MKKRFLFMLGMPVLVAAVAMAENVSKVRVIGQRVNLRAKADLNAEVVGQIFPLSYVLKKKVAEDTAVEESENADDLAEDEEVIKAAEEIFSQ